MSRRITGRSRRFPVIASADAGDYTAGVFWRSDGDSTHLTKDGSDLVGTWNDLSAGSGNVTQGTAGNKPLWLANTLNGEDVLQFNCAAATAKRMLRSNIAGNLTELGFTVALIWKVTTASSAGNYIQALAHNSHSTGNGGLSLESYTTTRTRRIRFLASGGANTTATFGNMAADTWEAFVLTASATADDAAATLAADVDGTAVSVTGTPNYSTVDGNHTFQTGTGNAAGSPDFSIAELWYWRRALSASERLAWAQDIGGTKYGLTIP